MFSVGCVIYNCFRPEGSAGTCSQSDDKEKQETKLVKMKASAFVEYNFPDGKVVTEAVDTDQKTVNIAVAGKRCSCIAVSSCRIEIQSASGAVIIPAGIIREQTGCDYDGSFRG